MSQIKIIDVRDSVLKNNEQQAFVLRQKLKREKTFFMNLMSSPGSGKTSVLERTIACLGQELSIGVMEADIDASVDAEKIARTGAKTIQLHTCGMCHLTADMVMQGMESMDCTDLDCVFLENIGNLVCPAEFDTGAVKNVMILSVPEGDDKPLKYPLMFSVCDVVLINKIDTNILFDFDMERAVSNIKISNPDMKIFPISAKTGEGFDAWIDWLKENIYAWIR